MILSKEQYIAKLKEYGAYEIFVDMGFMKYLDDDERSEDIESESEMQKLLKQ